MESRNLKSKLQANYSKRHEVAGTCRRQKCLIIKYLAVIQAVADNYIRKQKHII